MFRVVAQVKGVDRVYVVSAEYHALSLARQLNWHVIDESEQISESASVDAASRHCAREGVKALLRLPIDMPLVTPSDIETLFYFLEPAPSVVIVPSRDGTGTNALLRSPPDLFPSHFGPGSFALHLKEAEKAGAKVAIVRNERIALDIDEPKDLRAAAGRVFAPFRDSALIETTRTLERQINDRRFCAARQSSARSLATGVAFGLRALHASAHGWRPAREPPRSASQPQAGPRSGCCRARLLPVFADVLASVTDILAGRHARPGGSRGLRHA